MHVARASIALAFVVGCEAAFPVDDAVSAGEPSPCAATHRFCIDFDEGPLAAYPSAQPYTKGGGSMVVDTSNARSFPGALVTSAPSLAASSPPAYAFLGPNVAAGNPADMRLAFDLRVDARGTGDNPIATVGVTKSGQLYAVQIAIGGDGAWILAEYDSSASSQGPVHRSATLASSDWMHVRADLHVAAAGDASFASITVDGHAVFDRVPITPAISDGSPAFAIGITSLYGATTAWTLRFDNVTFDD